MSDRPMPTRIFLDTETTGLDEQHDVWEAAFAYDDGPVRSMILPHDLVTADSGALAVNRYHERQVADMPWEPAGDLQLRDVLRGKQVWAQNPAFDTSMLLARWGLARSQAPWHYRLVDLGSYAAGILGLRHSPGMAETVERLAVFGFDLPAGDHSAGGDVECLRACVHALETLRDGMALLGVPDTGSQVPA